MIAPGHQAEWVKSRYSTGYNNCVEVRSVELAFLEIKDSKIAHGQTIKVSPGAFCSLVDHVKEVTS